MPDHARKQLRDAAKTLLAAGSGWKSVTAGRVAPAAGQYPMLLVYAEGESADPVDVHPAHTQARTLTLIVEGIALLNLRAVETLENDLDEIAREVETLLTVASLGKACRLIGTEFELIHDQQDQPAAGTVRTTWLIDYYTAAGAPQTML